jgi:hypothetical protein
MFIVAIIDLCIVNITVLTSLKVSLAIYNLATVGLTIKYLF